MVTVRPISPEKADLDIAIGKPYMCLTGCLERFCATDEVSKSRRVKHKLIEESDIEPVKLRCIDLGYDVLQVLAIAFEVK